MTMNNESINNETMNHETIKMEDEKGRVLMPIARAAIAEHFGHEPGPDHDGTDNTDWLHEHGACFVTLMQHDNLRGCIGTLEAHRKLLDDVRHNAHAAAFRDTRFSPLTEAELEVTDIEISLLSPMQAMSFDSQTDALEQMRPGIDGIVFEYRHYRSTFLPQVWQQLPRADEFIAHLKHKAGLPVDFWADDVQLHRYTVSKWKERDLAENGLAQRGRA